MIWRILLVVVLQTAALVYMILDRQAMLDSSRVVTLKVVPVDPRDMFRGDYVILSYAISRLDLSTVEGDDEVAYGETVYVTMVPDGEGWKAAAFRRGRPFEMPGGVALRATVDSFDRPDASKPSTVRLTYGIESYFVPEGTGRAIEEEARKGELSIDAAVDDQGRAAIKAIRRGGEVVYVEGIL